MLENGFKETQLGPLPVEWDVMRFGEVATLQRGNDLPIQLRKPGLFPVVGSNGVVGFHNEYISKGPGVTVGRSGSVGRLFYVDGSFWPLNTTLWVKDFHGNDEKFVYFLLQTFDFHQYSAGVSVPTLNRNIVHEALLPLPPLPEQRLIAHVLSTVRQSIEATERVITATRELKRSLMKHLFTYGPAPINQADQVRLKETEIGEIPEDWVLQPLGDVATLQRGKDLPVDERLPGKYPVVGSNGIVGYHSEFVAHGPGVFVGRSGSVGQVSKVEEDYWPLNTTLWVKDFHNNDETFVYYLLTQFDFTKYVAGVSVPTLNRNLVHPVVVGIPSHTQQKQIAGLLDNVENKLLAEDQRKTALEALFNSLLHHLMTGKVRVKDLPTPTPP